jgi:hypothetical protein
LKKRKNVLNKKGNGKCAFSSELFIADSSNIEENVLKIVKKNNNSSKKR